MLEKNKHYIAKITKNGDFNVVYELKSWHIWIINSSYSVINILKTLVVLVSVLIPPLILITIPLMGVKNERITA